MLPDAEHGLLTSSSSTMLTLLLLLMLQQEPMLSSRVSDARGRDSHEERLGNYMGGKSNGWWCYFALHRL